MFCRNCGTENSDSAPTCTACGAELTAVNNPYQAGTAGPEGLGGAAAGKPENYLIQSILVTLCCCLPLGIPAIIYAAQVDSKWNSGDHSGSMASSANAKKWCWIAFGLGIAANLIAVAIQILAVGATAVQQQQGGF